MIDLKDGLSDYELTEKYGLSPQGLQEIFAKLIKAKLATVTYFEKRALSQPVKRVEAEKTRKCTHCGYQNQIENQRCDRCGQEIEQWLDTVTLTKILTGSLE